MGVVLDFIRQFFEDVSTWPDWAVIIAALWLLLSAGSFLIDISPKYQRLARLARRFAGWLVRRPRLGWESAFWLWKGPTYTVSQPELRREILPDGRIGDYRVKIELTVRSRDKYPTTVSRDLARIWVRQEHQRRSVDLEFVVRTGTYPSEELEAYGERTYEIEMGWGSGPGRPERYPDPNARYKWSLDGLSRQLAGHGFKDFTAAGEFKPAR